MANIVSYIWKTISSILPSLSKFYFTKKKRKKKVPNKAKTELYGASFTKQGKLVQERNSKTALMGGKIFAGDLLRMRKLKNTDATSHLHIDQRNIPSAAQISVVANKEIKKPQYTEKNRRPKIFW